MTKYFYLFVLIVIATMANAQTTQDAKDYINTNIVTNGTKSITASKLNTALNKIIDAIDSSIVYVDSNAVVVSSIDSTYYTVLNYTNTPPSSPITGAIYAIGNSPTGAWIGHAKEIAIWNGSAWSYIAPEQGDFFFNITNDYTYQYRNGSWVRVGGIPLLHNGNTITGGVIVGTNNNASLAFETNNINRGRFDSIGRFHVYNLPTAGSADTFVNVSNTAGQLSKVGKSTFLNGIGGGGASFIPNGYKFITESRELQADDAGYILALIRESTEAQPVVLTIPDPSPLQSGESFVILNGGDLIRDKDNGFRIGDTASQICTPAVGELVLFTTTVPPDEGNPNVPVYVSTFTIGNGEEGNSKTALRYLMDNVVQIAFTKTKAEIDALIAGGDLVANALYEITGVHPTLYDDGTTSGTTVYLRAISGSELEVQGMGKFYNPKYNQSVDGFGIWDNKMYGAFSNIVGVFDYQSKESVTANNAATGILLADGMIQWVSGDWSAATSITGNVSGATADVAGFVSPSYGVGDKVIWGGYSWTNVNGNIGASVGVLNLNAEWTKNVYDTTNYNIAYDVIEYDYANDMIIRRFEKESNVDVKCSKAQYDLFYSENGFPYHSISVQQFGNPFNTSSYKGQLNILCENGYNESVNFSGTDQQYLTFESNSNQTNLTFGRNAYQYNLTFGIGAVQQNLIFGSNSNQQYLTFGRNAYQVNLTFGSGVNQTNLTFAENTQLNYNYQTINSNIEYVSFRTKAITVPDLSTATYIFDGNIKEVYQRPDGTLKLKYMNDSDVLVVNNITD